MKKKNGLWLVLILVLCAAVLAGCGGSSKSTMEAAAADESWNYAADNNSYESASTSGAIQPELNTDRKIVYEASLQIESKTFDEADGHIRAAVEGCGAYIENTNMRGTKEEMSRRVDYTVRVPVEQYRQFLEAVGSAGNVLSMQESASDITASYIDVQARIKALENQRDRLNELAKTAETTADLLEIESQLSDVQYQLENYLAQMRSMDNRVSYSTVSIYLREVTVFTPTSVSFLGQLNEAFNGGLDAFLSFVKELILAVVYLWPFLLLAAVIVVCYKMWRKKHPKKPRKPKATRVPPVPPPNNAGPYPYAYTPVVPPQPPIEDAASDPPGENQPQ